MAKANINEAGKVGVGGEEMSIYNSRVDKL